MLENQLLREKTHGLVVENQELRQRLGMDALMTEEEAETKENGVGLVARSAESAAGAGPVVTPPEHLPMDSDGIDSSDSEVGLTQILLKSCLLGSVCVMPYTPNQTDAGSADLVELGLNTDYLPVPRWSRTCSEGCMSGSGGSQRSSCSGRISVHYGT